MVRLQRSQAAGCRFPLVTFNPTMVRLQPHGVLAYFDAPSVFQSHYGAIATRKPCASDAHCLGLSIPLWCDCNTRVPRVLIIVDTSFNPTMVRLQQRPHLCDKGGMNYFQSHYGAIATLLRGSW